MMQAQQFFIFIMGCCIAVATWAEAPAEHAATNEIEAAFVAAQSFVVTGPHDVPLLDKAMLKLPDGYVFIPMPYAARILEAMGNRIAASMLGMVFPGRQDAPDWFVIMDYENSGYIKDDDAKEWNADDLLENLKQGTEQANSERRTRGIPEMEVIGWVEKPTYNSASHRLVWSASSKDKSAATAGNEGVNYNTYALGREGFVSMNLVTQLDIIEQRKSIAKQLLGALEYNSGRGYADFDSSTDKVAAFGLAALVGGVMAKKLGLLALIAAFVLKFAKVIAISALALGGGLLKYFKRKMV